jgi:hypothetical protein
LTTSVRVELTNLFRFIRVRRQEVLQLDIGPRDAGDEEHELREASVFTILLGPPLLDSIGEVTWRHAKKFMARDS